MSSIDNDASGIKLSATRYTNKYGSCVRLTPTNYSRWHSGIEAMLMAGNHYRIATGTEQAPAPAAPNAAITSRQYLAEQSYEKRHRECWMMIYNSISENLQVRFKQFVRTEDPVGMWTSIIQNMDTTQNHVSSGRIYSDFFKEQWRTTDNLQNWISRLEDYRNKLSATQYHQLSDVMMVTKALTTLPVEWSMTRQEIWRLPLAEQTWEHVCQILQSHDEIVNMGRQPTTEPTTEPSNGDANLAYKNQSGRGRGGYRGRRGRGRGNRSTGGQRSDQNTNKVQKTIKCFYCGEEGHTERKCKRKENGEAARKAFYDQEGSGNKESSKGEVH